MTGFEREVHDLFLLCFCDLMHRASQRLVILVCFPYYFYGKTNNIASLSNEKRIFLHSFARSKERSKNLRLNSRGGLGSQIYRICSQTVAKMAKINILGAYTTIGNLSNPSSFMSSYLCNLCDVSFILSLVRKNEARKHAGRGQNG